MERLPDSPKEVNLWRVRILPIYPREKLLAVNRSPEQSEWSGLVRKDCSRFAKECRACDSLSSKSQSLRKAETSHSGLFHRDCSRFVQERSD